MLKGWQTWEPFKSEYFLIYGAQYNINVVLYNINVVLYTSNVVPYNSKCSPIQ